MTLSELNEHFEKIYNLNQAYDVLASLREKANIPAIAIEIADMKARIAKREEAVRESSLAVMAFVGSIHNKQTRLIFYYRFVCGQLWREVAAKVGISEASAKIACYRFLRKNR